MSTSFEHSAEKLPIYIRAYVPPLPDEAVGPKAAPTNTTIQSPRDRLFSDWAIILDTETTILAGQTLRFGVYQLRRALALVEKGIFYAADLSQAEIELLREYAHEFGFECMAAKDFIENVFFGCAYTWRANVIGFNLPFDLSRLAIGHDSARGTMKGGFTFKLSEKPWHPRIQIKHLSRRAALIQFTKPYIGKENKREQRKGYKRPPKRGSFIDIKTAAAALLSQSFDLASLTAFLRVKTKKSKSEEHGQTLSREYVAYAVNDVQATWECYEALLARFGQHGLTSTHLGKVFSEASLGKAYLSEMRIRPHMTSQPDAPAFIHGYAMSTYYGGRTEVRQRREVVQVAYCDFLSMYPTVCTLMGLWRFVIAERMTWKSSSHEVRRLMAEVSPKWLQDRANWTRLTTLVKVHPQDSILPIRAKYGDAASSTIGLNCLTANDGLWYTLADVIACKLLTGAHPEILEAITFSAGKPQKGLEPICIAGREEYRIDPYTDDFFKRLIDLRSSVKKRMKGCLDQERELLDAEQLALKILANSTAYGIYVEVIVSNLDRDELKHCYGPNKEPMVVHSTKDEKPGKYFHPLLATLITGAARLMLSLCEQQIMERGLQWAFCDTDSMAIARPKGMDEQAFFERVENVREFFAPMNPYEEPGSLLKLEDVNHSIGATGIQALYALCISAKRYVLFNLDETGRPVIRKASAHGLGHLTAPYGDDAGAPGIPAPSSRLKDIGVRRWQYDLWYQIILAHLEGHPDLIDFRCHPALNNPAAGRYAASTPDLLRWFREHSRNRPYGDQVKPFNFMTVFQARQEATLGERFGKRQRGRPKKKKEIRPVAPFHTNPLVAAQNALDRETGKPVSADDLKTYKEVLRTYHLSPEWKFLNGGPFDIGTTERRHIVVDEVRFIGKESNRWEDAMFVDLEKLEVLYGFTSQSAPKVATT